MMVVAIGHKWNLFSAIGNPFVWLFMTKKRSFYKWYYSRPMWIRIILLPFVAPPVFLTGLIAIIVLLMVLAAYWPVWAAKSFLQKRRCERLFLERMRSENRIANWSDTRSGLAVGNVTLLIELGPYGPTFYWWIPRPCEELNPDHIIPTWHKDQSLLWRQFLSQQKAIDTWCEKSIESIVKIAKYLPKPDFVLDNFATSIQSERILLIPWHANDSLSRRLYHKAVSSR
jgi:hypothetical protein